jgi:hypothetical protein
MQKQIRTFIVHEGTILDITGKVALVTGYRLHRTAHTIIVGGCGFDAGFDIVHALSYALHGMLNKPVGAIAPHAGVPCETAPETGYRAGYTLNHRNL